MKGDNVRLIAVLKSRGTVTIEQLQKAMVIQKNSPEDDFSIEEILVAQKMVSEAQIKDALSFMDKPSGKASVRRDEITTMMQVLRQEAQRQVTDMQDLVAELQKELGE